MVEGLYGMSLLVENLPGFQGEPDAKASLAPGPVLFSRLLFVLALISTRPASGRAGLLDLRQTFFFFFFWPLLPLPAIATDHPQTVDVAAVAAAGT